MQSRHLLKPLGPDGRNETVVEVHQPPRSRNAQELVGLEFLAWHNTNKTVIQSQAPLPGNSGLAQHPACEGHIVRSPKHTLHRSSHRSIFRVATMDLIRHDQRLLCQPVTGPGENQLRAVEFPGICGTVWHGLGCRKKKQETLWLGESCQTQTSTKLWTVSLMSPSFWKVVKRILGQETGPKKVTAT